MAGDDERAEKNIMDIPYSVLFNIVQSLDADKGWEALAAETGYTFDKIRLLELEGARLQGSPSRSLLLELGSRNTTIRQLYTYLSAIRRYREMKILEGYVNSPVPSASASLRESHGLKGLKSLESKSCVVETSDSLKGLKPPSIPVTPDKKGGASSTVCSDNVNFNQPVSGCDPINSMQLAEKDKRYTGKQMPVAAKEPNFTGTSVSTGCRENVSLNSNTIKAPPMKPSAARPAAGAATIKDIQKQMSGDRASTFPSSCGQRVPPVNRVQSHSSATSSTPSPFSDIPSSSSLSSVSGLDSFPAWLDSSLEMQVAAIGSACFTYHELQQATGDFSPANKLGEGAFGTVYFGVLRQTKCAVKKMTEVSSQDTCDERSSQMKREMTSLLKYRHENLVTLYGYALDGPSLCLVYQYMPNGSLEDRLLCKKGSAPLLWNQRLNIMVGACQGLNFIHTMGQQPLIHGDIKSANILLDKHMEARLGDLGQAQQATGRDGGGNSSRLTHITRAQASTKLYGTRAYQPGEVQSGGKASVKSDIFAMGVVLLEVFSGQQAYDDRREGDRGLADYFRNNVTDEELEKWLPQLDSRAGECPEEVAMAMLQLAYKATDGRKRNRPDSSKFLQEMTGIEQHYKDLTGQGGVQSMLGSEHSCHMSHTSSPDNSRTHNLTGAPEPPGAASAKGHGAFSQKESGVNLSPSQSQKGFVTTDNHHYNHAYPDNRLAINMNRMPSYSPQPADAQQQRDSITPSPIDYFPQGQPLPAPFRLQQAYDRQNMGQAEKKKIARLSECYPTREVTQKDDDSLPTADPAKLAALEQFDRLNMGQTEEQLQKGHDLDSADLQSDPKKLAALKQFDSQNQSPPSANQQEGGQDRGERGGTSEGELSCDPKKLAYLRQFDEHNVGGGCHGNDDQQPQQEDRTDPALPSDPRKLAYLTHFDENSCPPVTSPLVSGLEEDKRSTLRAGDSFPVSQVDYVITSAQKEALRACNESLHHLNLHSMPAQNETTSAQLDHTTKPMLVQSGASVSSPSAEPDHSAHTKPVPVPSGASAACTSGGSQAPCSSAMLARQRNFFQMYEQAMQGMNSDDDYPEEDDKLEGEDDEDADGDDDNNVDSSVGMEEEMREGVTVQQGSLVTVKETVPQSVHHRDPSEQDEESNINLDYFKERAQYYGKAFKKTPYAAHC